jgi:multicomponent Na+:H+ antiporter subunit E
MKAFLWNIFLAAAWAFAAGDFGIVNFAFGFALGYIVLGFAQYVVGESNYYQKVGQIVRFTIFYIWQLILSNFRVAYDVLTPTYYMRPGIIAVPLDAKTDEEITLLANLITLTPGSLSLDVSEDRTTLYIHTMFIDDVEQVRRELKEGLERRVLEVLR